MGGTADPLAGIGTPVMGAAPPPAAPAGGDPLAGIGTPVGSPAAPPPPAAGPTIVQGHNLSPEPNNTEGLYQMTGAQGESIHVPYSKVETAKMLGYQLPGEGNALKGDAFGTGELARYAKDSANDPSFVHQVRRAVQEIEGAPPVHGAVKAALQVPNTVIGLLERITNAAKQKADKSLPAGEHFEQSHATEGLKKVEEGAVPGSTQPVHGGGEMSGAVLEQAAEWLYGEGEARAAFETLSYSGKLKKLATAIEFLEKHPTVAAAARNGMMGAGQGAQAALHGATPGEAAETAGLGAAGGLILEGAGAGASKLLSRSATTLEDVGGVATPVSAEVRNAKPTTVQAAGQESIQNAARNTLADRLQEVNESRAVPDLDRSRALPARTGPFQFELRGLPTAEERTGTIAQEAEPFPRKNLVSVPPSRANAAELGSTASTIPSRIAGEEHFMTGSTPGQEAAAETVTGGGTLRTQDPNVVKAHISTLNDLIESPDFEKMPAARQQELMEARGDAQRQMASYHQEVRQNLPGFGRANFDQIDIPQTVRRIGSYSEAASHLEGIATDGYNSISDALALNDISGGKFAAIRNANKQAWKAYTSSTTAADLHTAMEAVEASNEQMTHLLENEIGGAVSPKELAGFNDAYRQAQTLKFVGATIDRSFTGNASAAARSWEYRGFNGTQMMQGLNSMERRLGRAHLERVIGRDNLNTLYQVAELNRTGASRARFGTAVNNVSHWLSDAGVKFAPRLIAMGLGSEAARAMQINGYYGAGAGEIAYETSRMVMNAILTNPKIAQNFIYSVKTGTNPRVYAPFVGAMITQEEIKQRREQEQQQQQQEKP